MNNLKQMGAFHTIAAYNKEISKWLLQVPTMSVDEQIFHSGQGLKKRIILEIERSEVSTLEEAMRIADRMESLYNSNRGSFKYNREKAYKKANTIGFQRIGRTNYRQVSL